MSSVVSRGLSLAKKPQKDYRIEVTKQLNYHINDDEAFKGRHTHGQEGAFTRRRLLPFGNLIVSILRMGKQGLQREMDSFFRETENEEFNIRRITKGGFSKSRRNLAPEVFLELNDIVWRGFYKQVDYLGYHRHKLLALDGTFLNLPNHASIHKEFGIRAMGRGQNKDVPKSMCLLSMLYDPVNYLNLDVQMGETDGSELQLLLQHLPKIDKGDIVMLDRGYPSRYLFSILASKGSHFIVRMKPNWLPVKQFIKSRKKDITITMEVPDGDFERYRKEFPGMRKTVKYKLKELAELYCIRWGIEEGYKMYKARVQVEAFSGKTATAVKQDIYAKAMMMTMCEALAFPIEERVIKEYKEEQQRGTVMYGRKINRTFAYWSAKGILIGMFIKGMIRRALAVFDKQVEANTEAVRPGRWHLRKKRPPRMYQMNYKDL